MRFEHPSQFHIPQLRSLWKAAFGDEDAYLDLFFRVAFSPDRCRCVMEQDRVLAALYWFDVSCDGAPMAYLYAVATDPAARGRGLCRALMEDVKQLLARRGCTGILLKAADEGLRQMYQRMGYTPCTTICAQPFAAADRAVHLQKIDTAEYARLRQTLLPMGGVLQEGITLDFLAEQTQFYRGNGFLAAVSVYDGDFFCHELLGDISAAPGILRAFAFDRGVFRYPGDCEAFASFCPLIPDCPVPRYFGLSLE